MNTHSNTNSTQKAKEVVSALEVGSLLSNLATCFGQVEQLTGDPKEMFQEAFAAQGLRALLDTSADIELAKLRIKLCTTMIDMAGISAQTPEDTSA